MLSSPAATMFELQTLCRRLPTPFSRISKGIPEPLTLGHALSVFTYACSILGRAINHDSEAKRFAQTGTVSMCNHRFKARALLLYLSLN